jgi:hypothetical protein
MSPYPNLARTPIALVSRRTRRLLTKRHLLVGQLLPIGLLLLAGLLLLMGCQPERSAPSTYGTAEVQEAAEATATSEKASTHEGGGQVAPLDAVGAGAPVSAALVDQEEIVPEEAARLVESDAAVPLCGVLDSISVGDADGRPVFRMHLQSGAPIAFVATGELKEELSFLSYQSDSNRGKPSFFSYPFYFFGRGCGMLGASRFVYTGSGVGPDYYGVDFFVGIYAVDEDAVVLLRHMRSTKRVFEDGQKADTRRHDRAGKPLWASRYAGAVSPALVDQARGKNSEEPTGPSLQLAGPVGQQVGQVVVSTDDTLRFEMHRLRPYGEWKHMVEGMHAREEEDVYPHVLLYVCDYEKEEHEHCGYTKEELAFMLSEVPGSSNPIPRYIPYRIDGSQLTTRDSTIDLRLMGGIAP